MSDKILEKLDTLTAIFQKQPSLEKGLSMEIEMVLEAILNNINTQSIVKTPETSGDQPILIWSDGACTGNPGPGGWGTIVDIDDQRCEFSGGSLKTTNNIMEMTGVLEGIKRTPEGCSIVLTSDSQYLVKGMTTWLKGWKKKGWKKADGKEVKNKELWKKLDAESQKRDITWVWVKGHAGHQENERCDQLARKAIPH